MRSVSFQKLAKRAPRSHKGDYGRLLILAGSEGFTGAAHLAGLGAMRSGAGLVTLGVPRSVYGILARREAEVMVKPFLSTPQGTFAPAAVRPILNFAKRQDVIAAGPGLSVTAGVRKLVLALIRSWEGPLVLDADALNVLEGSAERLKRRKMPAVLTPHAGEFVRLFGGPLPGGDAERKKRTLLAARQSGCVILLKGHRTVIASPRGEFFVNPTGNPGMATGGSGDVLTGILAALLGQGMAPFDAACAGAYVHGLAGDMAARVKGQISLIAGDIADALPEAFIRALRTRSRK